MACDFLDTFLPDHIRPLLDLNTLSNANLSFVDHDLSATLADVVFNCQISGGDQDAFVSILIEHKSYKDPLVAVQLLSYLAKAYQQQAKNNRQLTPVIPLLFYHGKDAWQYQSLIDLFRKLPSELKDVIPNFRTSFIDLSTTDERKLIDIQNAFLTSALLLQKYSKHPEQLIQKIDLILGNFNNYTHKLLWESLTIYFFNLVDVGTKQFETLLLEVPIHSKEKVMSLYDNIINKGIEKGRVEGKVEGIEEGRVEGIEEGIEKAKKDTVVKGYISGISVPLLCNITDLPEAKVLQIIQEYKKSTL